MLPGSFSPKKILVCQLRQLGDVVLATPALELLRRRFPEAALHLLTEKKCVSLLEGNPHLDHIWALDKRELSSLWKEIAWYRKVAATGYDLVVDFQQLPRCRWVVAFSHARVRLSYTPAWYNRWLYNLVTPMQPGYAAQSKASVLAPLGIVWNGEKPRLYLREQERQDARTRLAALGLTADQTLITLDPTHRRATRRWPSAHYAALVQLLHAADPSLRFLPLWGPGEEEDIRALAAGCPPETLLLPSEILSLREMAACIAQARLHVGNCSAPRHIAVAVDTPTCTILGSTSSVWTYPSPEHQHIAAGLACQPCEKDTCPHCRCLHELQPETVAEKVLSMLRR